jgi:hypothetical protein
MLVSALLALALATDPTPKRPALKDVVKGAMADPEKVLGTEVAKLPFTPDSIKQVVASFQPQIQGCYEEHLAAKDKAVEGTLKTTFVITAEGLVKGAKVNKKASSLKDARLHECVEAVLSVMEFPKPPDGRDQPIEFPFNLKAQR